MSGQVSLPGSHGPLAAVAPMDVRVAMTHASLQILAQDAGVPVLHLKGPAIDADLRSPRRASADADVLVPPHEVVPFTNALERRGWRFLDTFESGSPFGHSRTARHPVWGLADIHRHIPGTGNAGHTFTKFVEAAQLRRLSGVPMLILGRTDQALMIILHAARSGQVATDRSRAAQDIRAAWSALRASEREAVQRRASEIGAHLPLNLALREDVSAFADRPDYDLWQVSAYGGTRTEEWMARVKAAPSAAARARVLARMAMVNRPHLESELGRPATTIDVLTEFRRRAWTGVRELTLRARQRSQRHGPRA
ncbi:MAG: nucleotidyltransferase family protein [Nostocoides sp.]